MFKIGVQIRIIGCGIALSAIVFPFTLRSVSAAPYTPLAWQQRVEAHSNPAFVGQRKHLTWIRDLNRNFIDDEIERRFGPKDRVNVIIDLNGCVSPGQIREIFAKSGIITYIGRFVSSVYLEKVLVADLPAIAERPEVAMIEWQAPETPEMDVASRTVQAFTSVEYPGMSAQGLGLDGSGINIAIVDTGVNDGQNVGNPDYSGALPASVFVAGYDAWDPTDPGNGMRNPRDLTVTTINNVNYNGNHGTTMALVALGRPVIGQTCRNPGAGNAHNCAGIAPAAGLVDVNRCGTKTIGCGTNQSVCYDCQDSYTAKALDWVGANAQKFNIRIVNLSFSRCYDSDGTDAFAQQVNYLSAIGLVVVASYANANNPSDNCPGYSPGFRITKPPGAASFAIDVNATDDKGTVLRSDDTFWSNYLVGPRSDFNFQSPDVLALKPDLSAPGQNLSVYRWQGIQGTSPSAAIVSGAAALILQRFPAMTPDSLKQLLVTTADATRNTPYNSQPGPWGTWDKVLGWGMLNIGETLQQAIAQSNDLKFPNCLTGAAPGQPCLLASGDPSWNNQVDITTDLPPHAGVPNGIKVPVRNDGNASAKALVHFGVYVFGVGSPRFHHIGTQQVTVPAHNTTSVHQPWTPEATDHQCVQVSIAYGFDADYSNNLTQRNIQISPSIYRMRVENPFQVPADFEIKAKSHRIGWNCTVKDRTFTLDPFNECPRTVEVGFDPPPGTKPGQQATCDITVYAKPHGSEARIIGGVSVRTFVPRPCRVIGGVVDVRKRPVAGARVTATPAIISGGAKGGAAAKAETDANGVFMLSVVPDVPFVFSVEKKEVGAGHITLFPGCGLDLPLLVLSRDKLQAETIHHVRGAE